MSELPKKILAIETAKKPITEAMENNVRLLIFFIILDISNCLFLISTSKDAS